MATGSVRTVFLLCTLLGGCGAVPTLDDALPLANGLSIPCPVAACAGWSFTLYTSQRESNARARSSSVIGAGVYYHNLTWFGD